MAFQKVREKTTTEDRDIDVALELMPTDGKRKLALANFSESFGDWKRNLARPSTGPLA
jgi:hypothetical protein